MAYSSSYWGKKENVRVGTARKRAILAIVTNKAEVAALRRFQSMIPASYECEMAGLRAEMAEADEAEIAALQARMATAEAFWREEAENVGALLKEYDRWHKVAL